MSKKLTKKKALEIAEYLYNSSINAYRCLYPLCHLFRNTELDCIWSDYWKDINTDEKMFVESYFCHQKRFCFEEEELLRLLTLHMFIEDVYG